MKYVKKCEKNIEKIPIISCLLKKSLTKNFMFIAVSEIANVMFG